LDHAHGRIKKTGHGEAPAGARRVLFTPGLPTADGARQALSPSPTLPHRLTSLPAPLRDQVSVLFLRHHVVHVALVLELKGVEPFWGGGRGVSRIAPAAPPQRRQLRQGGRPFLRGPLTPAPAGVHDGRRVWGGVGWGGVGCEYVRREATKL